jgi:transposase-like protein
VATESALREKVVAAGQGSPATATAPEIAEGLSTLLSRSPAGNGADKGDVKPWSEVKSKRGRKKQYPTREAAETALLKVADTWDGKYAITSRSWENNREDLATMFDYTPEIRRLIYTPNLIEGYNRQLRKVTQNRAAFPSPEAARKLLWLAHRDIAKKWTMPIPNWPIILNQLAIRFEDRFPI